MSWDWILFSVTVVANLFFLFTIMLAQRAQVIVGRIRPRRSIIPGTTQPYLHFQDFWVQKWGDPIGLSLVQFAFVSSISDAGTSAAGRIVFIVSATVFIAAFAVICLQDTHKPDYGCDEGGFTAPGFLHLIYFGINASIGCAFCYQIIAGQVGGAPMWAGVVGAVFYGAMWIIDIRSGHFEPIRRS